MMQLRGLVLFTLFLSNAARRSMRVDDSHHNAQQQDNTLIETRGVSVEARDALLPGVLGKALSRGRGSRPGALRAAHTQRRHGGVAPQAAGQPVKDQLPQG